MNAVPSDDSFLLSKVRKGDPLAFKRLYEQHYRKIFLFAKSFLKDKEASEEILQETFLNLWVNREKIDPQLPVQGLLFTISKRLVLDAFRKVSSTQRQLDVIAQQVSERDNHTENDIYFSDLMRFASQEIDKLPKQQQTVFRLSKVEGLTYEEISIRLDISKNTVKNHLIAAVKSLRTRLEQQGILHLVLIYLFS